MNLLFVCSRNQWRSPTAERIFRDDRRFAARSCGLSRESRRKLTAADLSWADVVFVMEPKHRKRIERTMRSALGQTPVYVLDIPDEYQFMDPELVELLQDRVDQMLSDG